MLNINTCHSKNQPVRLAISDLVAVISIVPDEHPFWVANITFSLYFVYYIISSILYNKNIVTLDPIDKVVNRDRSHFIRLRSMVEHYR